MSSATINTFCHIEKTGGTTLNELLRANFPGRHCDMLPVDHARDVAQAKDIKRALLTHPGMVSLAGHSMRPWVDYGPYNARLTFYTVLRPAVARYVSDFNHDRLRRDYDGTLEDWLQYEDRWNFQTRALAGEENLEKAKDILNERFAVVGAMSSYDDFVHQIRLLFLPHRLRGPVAVANRAGARKTVDKEGGGDRKSSLSAMDIDPQTMKRIEEKNALDHALYEFVEKTLGPAKRRELVDRVGIDTIDAATDKPPMWELRRLAARAHRNILYKPSVLHRPFSYHALPRNAVNSQEYYEGLPASAAPDRSDAPSRNAASR